jgi:DMSO/TMAO reductase YedYZ molybdopterin-dependent catalytic subunit
MLSGVISGLLAGAIALGVAELIAGLTGPAGSPVVAVGGAAIDMTPIPVKDFAIAHFGSHDKTALTSSILVLLAVFAAVIGVLAVRWLAAGLAGLAVFGALGVSAALTRPTAGVADVLPTVAGVAVAAAALVILVRAARGTGDPAAGASMARGTPGGPPARAGRPGTPPGRRGFLAASAGAAVAAAAGGGIGDLLLRRFNVTASRAQVRLPAAATTAPRVSSGTELPVSGLSSFYTPNASFYRVDTDLVLPQVSPDQWTLQIGGMVDRPVELTFAGLLRLPLTEADITLVCVSNEVGGPYAGNARWLGASLPALLRRAGIKRGADQVLSTSVDGMTISTPVSAIMDGRNALLAVGMNGQPLPVAHGFPARMVVPGLYGYTSATKWVTKLEVTTFRRSAPTGRSAGTPPWRRSGPNPGSTCRSPSPRSRRDAWRWPGWPGPRTAASGRCRSARTAARGRPPGWPAPTASTPGGSGCGPGTPPRGCTSSRCARPTAPARRRPRDGPACSPAAPPARTRWW